MIKSLRSIFDFVLTKREIGEAPGAGFEPARPERTTGCLA